MAGGAGPERRLKRTTSSGEKAGGPLTCTKMGEKTPSNASLVHDRDGSTSTADRLMAGDLLGIEFLEECRFAAVNGMMHGEDFRSCC